MPVTRPSILQLGPEGSHGFSQSVRGKDTDTALTVAEHIITNGSQSAAISQRPTSARGRWRLANRIKAGLASGAAGRPKGPRGRRSVGPIAGASKGPSPCSVGSAGYISRPKCSPASDTRARPKSPVRRLGAGLGSEVGGGCTGLGDTSPQRDNDSGAVCCELGCARRRGVRGEAR